MNFGILVFQSADALQKFERQSQTIENCGIESEQLAENILLITKGRNVDPAVWGRYRSSGFRKVCGDWISTWHEDKELRDRFLKSKCDTDLPFVEAYWGDNACVISEDLENK